MRQRDCPFAAFHSIGSRTLRRRENAGDIFPHQIRRNGERCFKWDKTQVAAFIYLQQASMPTAHAIPERTRCDALPLRSKCPTMLSSSTLKTPPDHASRSNARFEVRELTSSGIFILGPKKSEVKNDFRPGVLWWARPDSNREPKDYESPAPPLSYRPFCIRHTCSPLIVA